MKKISEIEAYEEIYPHKLYVNYWTDCWDQCYYGFSANDEKSDPKDDDVVYVRGDLAHPWNILPKEKPTTIYVRLLIKMMVRKIVVWYVYRMIQKKIVGWI